MRSPHIIDVSATTFDAQVMQQSMTVPVVVNLWAAWSGPCQQLDPVLEALAAEDSGRWLLAKVNVDIEKQIAFAFQVQSVPSVFGVVHGEVMPLFQGALPESTVRETLDRMLRVAAQKGLSDTTSTPAATSETDISSGPQNVSDGLSAGGSSEGAHKDGLSTSKRSSGTAAQRVRD